MNLRSKKINTNFHISLIEPFFHRAGHFTEEALALGEALKQEGATVSLTTFFKPTQELSSIETISFLNKKFENRNSFEATSSTFSLSKLINKSAFITYLINNLINFFCLTKANRKGNSIILCITAFAPAISFYSLFCKNKILIFTYRDFTNLLNGTPIYERIFDKLAYYLFKTGSKKKCYSYNNYQ